MAGTTADYLITGGGIDWTSAMNGWEGLVPEAFTIYLANRFGDVFLRDLDGAIHMLDVGAWNCQKVAENEDDFARRMEVHFDNWLMVKLTDKCVTLGMLPVKGECYAYRVPPAVGGKSVPGNIYIEKLTVYHDRMSRLYRKTKDLPAGTVIEMKGLI